MSTYGGSGPLERDRLPFSEGLLLWHLLVFLYYGWGRFVVVKLNSGVDYRGILACLDGYVNIAMEQIEEYVNSS
ncbi:hypothetical protein CMV_004673 [Castanea mollissima]|uniref:Sm domain-containing protein n=1 Tax=Castanea mollissima TaxID=60419 RepID=A0A8J4RSD4_9ROSI|nr:hypothetical protein CMV_004673 [Castanea mollissima]